MIHDPPASGVWNMSVDEALLTSVAAKGIPTLRFYQWDPPAVSLGYFQSWRDRASHAASESCDWVRRSTGGGAIVHHHELTYSFTWQAPPRGDISPFYDAFHNCFVAALDSVGVSTHRCERTQPQNPEPFLCFQRRAEGDLMLGEHKIGGSAQRRRRSAAIQHGSLLWSRSEFAPELPGISDLAAPQVDMHQFVECWIQHLESLWCTGDLQLPGFGADDRFTSGTLSADELQWADDLSNGQFSAEKWNAKR